MSAKRNEGGFSLVELMVAMVVMSIGSLGVAKLATTTFGASRSARLSTEATMVGTDKLESLRVTGLIVDGEDTVDAMGRIVENGPFHRSWTIEPRDDGTTGITVVVDWLQDGESTHSVTFRGGR